MQKQKKIGPLHDGESKIKQKSNRACVWTQQNFKELYPTQPDLLTSSTFFTVALNYKGNILKVKLPTAISNSSLPYIFHKQIYKFLLNAKDKNPLLKTAQVVGFQTVSCNLLLDYQISIGKGTMDSKESFNCLEYIPEGRLKKYKIYKCLAIGGFSKVYLVRNLRDGSFYAMKVMLKKFISNTQKQSIIQNEKFITSQLNHPFIVKLNHAFQTTNFVCLVLDYCPGGQLFYYLKQVKRMSEQEARFYFIEILSGLSYLHQKKIIYRDLKPENLLINYDGHIKIADFGLSKHNMKQKELTYSFCGSTQYMPPQMILREGHSFGVDFYTLGALLYELVTGLPPFYSKDEQEIKESIINQQLSFPEHVQLSNEIRNLLVGLLQKNQKLRIGSMKGLKQILFHPWIGKVNSQQILSKQLEPPYIPSIDQFNFDENQLGEDQEEFTRLLLSQVYIPENKQVLVYKDFEFINENNLRIEVQQIYDKYSYLTNKLFNQNEGQISVNNSKQQKKNNIFKKCNSLKNLKNRNTCAQIEKNRLKRQASSPYLRSASTNNLTSLKRGSKTGFSNSSPEKIFKSLLGTKHKESITRSLSKKNFKGLTNHYSLQKLGHSPSKQQKKSIKKKIATNSSTTNLNSSISKANKQNHIDPEIIQNVHKLMTKTNGKHGNRNQMGSGNTNGTAFLKKKKLVYNYIA